MYVFRHLWCGPMEVSANSHQIIVSWCLTRPNMHNPVYKESWALFRENSFSHFLLEQEQLYLSILAAAAKRFSYFMNGSLERYSPTRAQLLPLRHENTTLQHRWTLLAIEPTTFRGLVSWPRSLLLSFQIVVMDPRVADSFSNDGGSSYIEESSANSSETRGENKTRWGHESVPESCFTSRPRFGVLFDRGEGAVQSIESLIDRINFDESTLSTFETSR